MKISNDKLIYEFQRNYDKRKLKYKVNSHFQLSEIYEKEINRSGIVKGSRVLEIGFGDCSFLNWARDNGYRVEGVEINPFYVEKAKELGHRVYLGKLEENKNKILNQYDLICCFDMIEHLSYNEISKLFRDLFVLMKREGKVLARIPNGASPFGRLHQHSDLTHATTLTGAIISDICMITGFEVVAVCNSARSYFKGRKKRAIFKPIAYMARALIEIAIGLIYFGEIVPMDPNITVLIKKRN